MGGVCASDAFFPFRDGLDAAAAAGIAAVIQPGGSVRDDEVIAAADEHGIAMVFTGERHFRHWSHGLARHPTDLRSARRSPVLGSGRFELGFGEVRHDLCVRQRGQRLGRDKQLAVARAAADDHLVAGHDPAVDPDRQAGG